MFCSLLSDENAEERNDAMAEITQQLEKHKVTNSAPSSVYISVEPHKRHLNDLKTGCRKMRP